MHSKSSDLQVMEFSSLSSFCCRRSTTCREEYEVDSGRDSVVRVVDGLKRWLCVGVEVRWTSCRRIGMKPLTRECRAVELATTDSERMGARWRIVECGLS